MKNMSFPAALVAAFTFVLAFPIVGHAQSYPHVRDATGRLTEINSARLDVHTTALQQQAAAINALRSGVAADSEQVKELLRKANEGCWAVDKTVQVECFKTLDKAMAVATARTNIDKDAINAFVAVVRRDRVPNKRTTTTTTVPGAGSAPATTQTVVTEEMVEPEGGSTTGGINLADLGFGAGTVRMNRFEGANPALGLPGSATTLEFIPQAIAPAERYRALNAVSGGNSVWKQIGITAGFAALGCAAGYGAGAAIRHAEDRPGHSQQSAGGLGCAIGAGLTGIVVGIWQFSQE